MDYQIIVDWFNSWPVDVDALKWVSPRIIILGTIIYFCKVVARMTPWAWDNVLVAAIDKVFSRFKNKQPLEDEKSNPK